MVRFTPVAALLRRWRRPRNPLFPFLPSSLLENPRPFSSALSRIESLDMESSSSSSSSSSSYSEDDDLRRRILRLRFPRRSATEVLERWVVGDGKITISELRRIIMELRRAGRYKHALEILTWMESCRNFQLSSSDHATRLDLITKLHSITEAEEYFGKLSGSASRKSASFPLLHYYVKGRDLEKAETLMAKLQNDGMAVDAHPFNEMMKLYMATGQYEKVLCVIQHMKRSKIPCNVLSYNLWMNACGEVSGPTSVEMVHKEMVNDKNIEVGWSTYSTLASIYSKYRLRHQAYAALRTAEKKLSVTKRLGYSFIMTLYASLNDKEGVLRLWESSKRVPGRITCANYMCMLLCLVKIGDLVEAERIFRNWESECRKYDVRVSNILLGAYVRKGWMDKAEKLHLHTLEKGALPNYKTWEILMEGWVKTKRMDRAVEAMKKGFSMLKCCHWRPPPAIVEAIAKYFEEQGNIEGTRKYMKVLQGLKIMSLPLYKCFLRTYINANTMPPNISKMIARDQIDLDEETKELILCASKVTTSGA